MGTGDASSAKICVICGVDCSHRPRTKDKRGRYYCQSCYDEALTKLRARKARGAAKSPATRAPQRAKAPPRATTASGMDDFLALDSGEAVALEPAAPPTCPGCGQPMPRAADSCRSCGYTRLKPVAAPPAPRAGGISAPSLGGVRNLLLSPWGLFLGITGVLLILFLLGRSSLEFALLYVGVASVLSLGVGIWVLVCAFRDSVTTGVLCLCVPFYAFYFVLSQAGQPRLTALFTAAFITNILTYFLPFEPEAL